MASQSTVFMSDDLARRLTKSTMLQTPPTDVFHARFGKRSECQNWPHRLQRNPHRSARRHCNQIVLFKGFELGTNNAIFFRYSIGIEDLLAAVAGLCAGC